MPNRWSRAEVRSRRAALTEPVAAHHHGLARRCDLRAVGLTHDDVRGEIEAAIHAAQWARTDRTTALLLCLPSSGAPGATPGLRVAPSAFMAQITSAHRLAVARSAGR